MIREVLLSAIADIELALEQRHDVRIRISQKDGSIAHSFPVVRVACYSTLAHNEEKYGQVRAYLRFVKRVAETDPTRVTEYEKGCDYDEHTSLESGMMVKTRGDIVCVHHQFQCPFEVSELYPEVGVRSVGENGELVFYMTIDGKDHTAFLPRIGLSESLEPTMMVSSRQLGEKYQEVSTEA